MIGLELILGHLIGDYILQNDWMAKNKTNPHPGKEPHPNQNWIGCGPAMNSPELVEERAWYAARRKWLIGHLACSIHCLLYSLSVYLFTWKWIPLWGLLACFLIHWPIDRFRLASWWMRKISGQSYFASKDHPMFPWSVVMVDNIFHLLTLYGIAWWAKP